MSITNRKFDDQDVEGVFTSNDNQWVHLEFTPDNMPRDCIGLTEGDVRALAEHFGIIEKPIDIEGEIIPCSGCDTPLTYENAGGYRCFCHSCVEQFPPFPDCDGGYVIEGKAPHFRWKRVS